MMHEDVSPSWDSNFGSLVLIRVFLIHLAVQVQAISCTLLLLYSCYIFGPLALLQNNNRMGVRSTRVCPP